MCKQEFPSSLIIEHQNLCLNQHINPPFENQNVNFKMSSFEEAKVSSND